MAKRKKGIRLNRLFLLLLVMAGIIYLSSEIITYLDINKNHLNQNDKSDKDKSNATEEKNKQLKENYEACLNKPYSDEELNPELQSKIAEIDNLIIANNYEASVYFEDLTTGLTYKYKPTTIYYGCSLIKLVDALYLINATNNGLNLDTETIEYSDKYVMAYSDGMKKHQIGDAVSLRNLIKYTISVSDNSAHLMLLDYIGFNNLKTYGQKLGGKVILSGGDNFGNQTAEDTNIYLKEAYRIIKGNAEYGPFLKEIMDNDERNAFNTDDIRIYHKYGSYANYYHDIGLSLDKYPYAISILTLHENRNYEEVIQNIHQKVRELRDLFYSKREEKCYNEIYKGETNY